ncbi:MAG: hypothetical protein IKR48_06685 [Kiritimatiellae bacterium]|nr:hypothetical protein [Kiritimatiellia bacterium]
MNRTIDLEFITPLFSHGATDQPEIRPASIRGQLHAWFRIVGGDIEAERRVFGGIKQRTADLHRMPSREETWASRIVVRVSDVKGTKRSFPTLPHKRKDMSAPRMAFDIGTKCRIVIMDRLSGLAKKNEELFNRAVNAWLLMGTLGYRATRAAGSFVWNDDSFPMPTAPLAYQDTCRNLLHESKAKAKVAVLNHEYNSAEDARCDISDSLGGRGDRFGQSDLARLHDPLGFINGRGDRKRKTSPLKYRIVRVENKYRIVAFWDGRSEVTNNSDNDLYNIVDLLAKRKPKIGEQLKNAF